MQSAIPEQIATNRLGPSASAGSVLITEQPLFGRTQQREKNKKKTEQLSKNGWRLRALNNADIKKSGRRGGWCVHPFNRVQSRKANPKNLYLIKFHMRRLFCCPRLRLLGITVLLGSFMRVFTTLDKRLVLWWYCCCSFFFLPLCLMVVVARLTIITISFCWFFNSLTDPSRGSSGTQQI